MRITGCDEIEAMDSVSGNRSLFVGLLALRDIKRVSIFSNRFLELHAEALACPRGERVMFRLSAYDAPERAEESAFPPVYGSTGWTVIYVGHLGLNGTEIPAVVRAVSYLFRELIDEESGLFLSTGRQYPGFAPFGNAMLLRALLRSGFQDDERVRAACRRLLDAVHGARDACRQKRGGYPCGWGTAKNLLLLNEFPEDLHRADYGATVEDSQAFLLSTHLPEGDFSRGRNSFIDHPRHWTDLG